MLRIRHMILLFCLMGSLCALCACQKTDTTEGSTQSATLPGAITRVYPGNDASASSDSSDAPGSFIPETTPSPQDTARKEQARLFLQYMDLQAKLFQLMIVTPEAISPDETVWSADSRVFPTLQVAGLYYQSKNMKSPEQLKTMTEGHQKAASLPLFICSQEEGGRINSLMGSLGTTPIKSMFTYRGDGMEKARQNGLTVARDMSSFGFNLNLAPVADVWSLPENKEVGERAYSDDFVKAGQLIGAAVQGFHEGGVMCVLKHFPGGGEAVKTGKEGLPVISKSLQELREQEWTPFLAGIRAGADMVMAGNLMVPAADQENPVPFSRALITDFLRKELGYDGLIITDALNVYSNGEENAEGQSCLKALQAGCDLLFLPAENPEGLSACIEYLTDAVQKNYISEERINESVLRVLELKMKYGLLDTTISTPAPTVTADPEAWTEASTE